jgi:hypothetical protein
MSPDNRCQPNDAGQVTILLLALTLALLSALPFLGAISGLIITQQRLNSVTDASAIAGAMELEFNQNQACETALNFKVNFADAVMTCEETQNRIKVTLQLPNTDFLSNFLLPNLVAIATAGTTESMDYMP